MSAYNSVLSAGVTREIDGTDYLYGEADRMLLRDMLEEINTYAGTNLRYLAELDGRIIPGAGRIVSQYIARFASEGIKAYLLSHMVFDKIPHCALLVLQLYQQFKLSEDYIPPAGKPASAHIYTRYDNAFRALKAKHLTESLLTLIQNPRDAFYLPFTVRMLASWRIPTLQDLLVLYATGSNITYAAMGITANETEISYPSFNFMKRELRFTGIIGLRYYPSNESENVLKACCEDPDEDVRLAAQKSINKLRALGKNR